MEDSISKLSDSEIQELIGELEHVYAEFLGDEASAEELLSIHKRILLLKKEVEIRAEWGSRKSSK